jgi:ribose transport system permease protein
MENLFKENIIAESHRIKKYRKFLESYGIIILLILAIVIISIFNPRFISMANIINLSKQIVPMGLIALGAMFVLIAGGLDLSAGVGSTMAGAIMGIVFYYTSNIFLSIIVCLASALIIGSINGLLITKVGFSAVIATLAMMTILQGGIQLVLGGKSIFLENNILQYISRGTILKIPIAFLILLFFYLIGYYLLNHTRFGVYTIAIGANENNAKMAGISIPAIKFTTYVLSSFLMGISGIVLVSRMALISPAMSGFPILLDGFSAAVIGGTSVTGGKGSIGGVFLGVIFIGIITNALVFLNIPAEAQDLYRGLLIAFALIFERVISIRKQ